MGFLQHLLWQKLPASGANSNLAASDGGLLQASDGGQLVAST